ncbi:hypothetical protein PHMEG_0009150 [Phytophthora megakarya]|uniref:Uncharacterized protein n=1 Tax=Phytophthora megakarya TaxID=4795 RepID=A0A225WIN6_9STRA|nr:hypothetical protein PHMEG_0009150 [Phytophthora megakarya]
MRSGSWLTPLPVMIFPHHLTCGSYTLDFVALILKPKVSTSLVKCKRSSIHTKRCWYISSCRHFSIVAWKNNAASLYPWGIRLGV